MDKKLIIKAFNEWKRLSIEEPDEFEEEDDSPAARAAFLKELKEGKEPSYGIECAEYFLSIIDSLYNKGHPHGGCCL